jgi:hypothetical protein
MATVNLGRIKFVWQGAYSGATAYVADDVVSYNGSSYICILASTGNLPTNTTYWSIMSSAGTNGTNGTDVGTTITTQGDILYRDASGLARLGAGTSGQYLKTNGSGANPAWSTVSTNHNGVAWLEYQSSSAQFNGLVGIAGLSSGDRIVVPFNTTTDPYDILGTVGSNAFQVNTTGAYMVHMHMAVHTNQHYKMFIYNNTNDTYAPRANATFTGAETFQAPIVSYSTGQGSSIAVSDCYWLDSSKSYQMRQSSDGSISDFNTTTSYLYGNYSINGTTSRNTIMRLTLTKLSGV